MDQELVRQQRIGRQFAHHDHAQAVHTSRETIGRQQFHHRRRLAHGPHEGHHDFDIGQAHLLAHIAQRFAFHLEARLEGIRHVTRRAAEAQHRVLFMRLVALTANEVGVFVGLEIRQTHDHRLRREGRSDGRNTFNQALHEIFARARIGRDQRRDGRLQIGRQRVVFEQRARMNADHAVDDELETRQAHAAMGQAGERERAVGITDVHHDLDLDIRHRVERDLLAREWQRAAIHEAGVATCAGHRH